jgi:hypothetical protein
VKDCRLGTGKIQPSNFSTIRRGTISRESIYHASYLFGGDAIKKVRKFAQAIEELEMGNIELPKQNAACHRYINKMNREAKLRDAQRVVDKIANEPATEGPQDDDEEDEDVFFDAQTNLVPPQSGMGTGIDSPLPDLKTEEIDQEMTNIPAGGETVKDAIDINSGSEQDDDTTGRSLDIHGTVAN